MQPVLTPKQMRQLEKEAFRLGVSSLLLMEEAAQGAKTAIAARLGGLSDRRMLMLAGPGNNGGDGLALARLLLKEGARVHVVLTDAPGTMDAKINLDYLTALAPQPVQMLDNTEVDALFAQPYDCVVDAIFGTGFHGELPEKVLRLTGALNQAPPCFVLALDAPTGLNSQTGKAAVGTVKASQTLALGYLKTGLCLASPAVTGSLRLAPLSLPERLTQSIRQGQTPVVYETADLVDLLPKRKADAHKGECGRVLLYAGSMGMAGAAAMAAQACLRAGAGLVTLACQKEIIPILQTLVPNAMCLPIQEAVKNPPSYDVFAAGCGLSQPEEAWQHILALWDKNKPCVFDADALNLLCKHTMPLGKWAVITPHPGEAARLLNQQVQEILEDKLAAVYALQEKFGCTVVLKGARSLVADGTRLAFNLTGSAALAKGGSGDALTGILAGVLAQQQAGEGLVSPFAAASAACLWLGQAGEEAERLAGPYSPLTKEVIDCLPAVIKRQGQRNHQGFPGPSPGGMSS